MTSRKSLRFQAKPHCEHLDERALPSVSGFRAALAARVAAAHAPKGPSFTETHAPAAGTVVYSKAPTFTTTQFVPKTSSATPSVTVKQNSSVVSGRFASNITVTRSVTIVASKPNPTAPTTTPTVELPVADPMTRLGSILGPLYLQQTAGQPLPTLTAGLVANLEIQGYSVRVDIRPSGDVGSMITAATSVGMVIDAVDPATGTAEGAIPIDRLLDLASRPEIVSITPVFKPLLGGAGGLIAL